MRAAADVRNLRVEADATGGDFKGLMLGAGWGWDLERIQHPKVPHDELINFQSSDGGATDCQSTDRNRPQGERTQRDRTQRQRSDRLRRGARCAALGARSVGWFAQAVGGT